MAKGQWVRTRRMIRAARSILEREQPMTIRQLFYRLVSVEEIENCLRDYRRVSASMTKARESGEIPWEWIVDRSRPVYSAATWSGLEEYGNVVARSYRRNAWQDQPCHVEVWSEKDAIVGSIEGVCDDYAVPLRAIRGFSSATVAQEVAALFNKLNHDDGKEIVVFYIGDHDASGRGIEQDIRDRVLRYGGGQFRIRRLAILAGDIDRFKLPPLRVKEQDPRASSFLCKYRDRCVEVDALPPEELRTRIRSAIEEVIDGGAWDRAMKVEAVEKETTRRVAETLRNLPAA